MNFFRLCDIFLVERLCDFFVWRDSVLMIGRMIFVWRGCVMERLCDVEVA